MNHQTAQGLASLGRGPDSMLVHMAPREVKSLQQLAMANGGSLTINPDTGLPEAGFLSKLLPTLIGAGLSIASGGTLTPLMSAMITGGGYGLATGSLKKGLMAGLGAYGGAGIGGALAGAGVQAAVAPELAAAQTGIGEVAGAANTAGGITPAMVPDYTANILSKTQPYVDASNAASTAFTNATPFERLQTAGSGISSLGSEAGRSAFMTQIGGPKALMQAGMMAAGPVLEETTKQPEIKVDKDMGQRYTYSPGTTTPTPTPDVPGSGNLNQNFGKEQRYFTPSYTQIDNDAAKKLYGFASGGPVEDMSNANAIGMNTGYPQSGIQTPAYTSPAQTPVSQNMISGSQDSAVNPYTGEAKFDEGGEVGAYSFDPKTQKFAQASPMANAAAAPTSTGEILAAYGYDPKTQKYTQTRAASPAYSAGIGEMDYGGGGSDSGGAPGTDSGPLQGDTPADGGGGGWDTSAGGMDNLAAKGGLMAALAQGGMSNLGDYSDGGRLLRGPGDGISDSIPAMIGKKQPARLADGEFVVPARIVSELGNGSTEAGARKLYAMMDRVQKARGKTVGKSKVAANSRASKYLPA